MIDTVPPDRRDQNQGVHLRRADAGRHDRAGVALVGERALARVLLIGLTAAVLATVAMIGVRRAYPRELVQALREGRPRVFGADQYGSVAPEPFGLARADASALEVAVEEPEIPTRACAGSRRPCSGSGRSRRLGMPSSARSTTRRGGAPDAVRSLARSGAIDAVPDVLRRTTDGHRRCGSRQPALCARSAYRRKPHPMQRRPSCTTATRSCASAAAALAALDEPSGRDEHAGRAGRVGR